MICTSIYTFLITVSFEFNRNFVQRFQIKIGVLFTPLKTQDLALMLYIRMQSLKVQTYVRNKLLIKYLSSYTSTSSKESNSELKLSENLWSKRPGSKGNR